MELEERFALSAEIKAEEDGPNCIGTALFNSGITNEERYVSPGEAYDEHLAGLAKINFPCRGCLAAWLEPVGNSQGKYNVSHMAIVTDTNNPKKIRVSDRSSYLGRVRRDILLSYLEGSREGELVFFIPPALILKRAIERILG